MAKIKNSLVILLCIAVIAYHSVRSSGVEEPQLNEVQVVSHPVDTEVIIQKPDYRSKVIQIASGFIGVTEVGGKGRGEKVQLFLQACGLGQGYDWCGCATKYTFNEAGIETPGANGWSPSWFPKNRLTNSPRSADVFSTFSISSKRINHVGIVKELYGNNVETLEGNIGRRAGGGLSRFGKLVRSKSEIHSYANWID